MFLILKPLCQARKVSEILSWPSRICLRAKKFGLVTKCCMRQVSIPSTSDWSPVVKQKVNYRIFTYSIRFTTQNLVQPRVLFHNRKAVDQQIVGVQVDNE